MGILTQQEEADLYKKVLRKQMFCSAVATACGAAVISCANISLSSLSVWDKVLVLVGIGSLTFKDLATQYNNMLRSLAKGKAPGEDTGEGDTTMFTKNQFPIGSGAMQQQKQAEQQKPTA